ncbi:triphosphoribosyl-dephospho-CoA synthase [Halalkalicoccus jeotgali]|uniref:Triphosphoribosyl-dephospho-CoA protein n=1 Tax=Halalkalicoccus jeotgali (strain DSM 18796 / CECT 7217 / JCM 14584 / KCTC 4019 / B3) TaxID=795797 RepID=D8JAS0_HALJB|nr:triphosphoribosyl-dephospho-CoA synthase [Halalkalicoccus jeotgali]ADJ14792.1 triphosphoribosyl-dephospho-CoA protein [Halalkalicoccus jeotgali B3]ELY39374.1 triphosphoribosyl-dephospho-CoA protein [Halalkalicoccus jeotgali B3]
MRPAENAQLALLLEVSGTPKPGNVDRDRNLSDLRYEDFLVGAVGAGRGLRAAETGPVGEAFERAVEGMAERHGRNSQFGALLLLVPLVRAASEGELSPAGAERVVNDTTVADAADFYRAFEHVAVFVSDPPADVDDLDVRRGAAAIPALEDRELTLADVMALGDADDVAREWTTGFERSFRVADRVGELSGPLSARAAEAFCEQLAEHPDTLVVKKHGEEIAREASRRVADAIGSRDDIDALAMEFVRRGINPGTTADIVAAGLFIALERGVEP